MTKDRVIGTLLLGVAFCAVSGLALITFFIFKEGLPVLLRVGGREFFLSSDGRPGEGHFGVLSMLVGSLVVTVGAMGIGVVASLGLAVVCSGSWCCRRSPASRSTLSRPCRGPTGRARSRSAPRAGRPRPWSCSRPLRARRSRDPGDGAMLVGTLLVSGLAVLIAAPKLPAPRRRPRRAAARTLEQNGESQG